MFGKTIIFILFNIFYGNLLFAKVDTLYIKSSSMKKQLKAAAITSSAYDTHSSYPVLYLLPGYSGSYKSWLNEFPMQQIADKFNIIVVAGDGGHDSFYLNSTVKQEVQYESFIVKELVGYMDSHYSTIKNRVGRAITGMSMGGHGALYLAIRNPDVFGAAGSMSGVLDSTMETVPEEKGNWLKEVIGAKLGNYSFNIQMWKEHSVAYMIRQAKTASLSIVIDCGIDDFLIESNRIAHKLFLENNIPHDYIERPGGHTAEYWQNAFDYQLLFLSKIFDKK